MFFCSVCYDVGSSFMYCSSLCSFFVCIFLGFPPLPYACTYILIFFVRIISSFASSHYPNLSMNILFCLGIFSFSCNIYPFLAFIFIFSVPFSTSIMISLVLLSMLACLTSLLIFSFFPFRTVLGCRSYSIFFYIALFNCFCSASLVLIFCRSVLVVFSRGLIFI